MNYIGIDLAARFSAAVVLDENGQVVVQFDSWGIDADRFAQNAAIACALHNPAVIAVEDIPYGLSRQAQIKPPLRAQGYIISHLRLRGLLEQTFFVAPASWQRGFPGVFKGGASGALAAATELGYTAPDMLDIYCDDVPPLGKEHAKERTKIRSQLKKATTDYNDAYLLAEWVRRHHQAGTLASQQGVQAVEF